MYGENIIITNIAHTMYVCVYRCVCITDTVYWFLSAAPIGKALYKLLVIQAFRADRLIAMASIFVATVLGETFVHSAEQELNLAEIVTNEVGPDNIYMIAMFVHVVHVYRM